MSRPSRASRRRFLKQSAAGAFVLALGPNVFGCSDNGAVVPPPVRAGDLLRHGPLMPANPDGVRLPAGFTARVLATTNEVVPGTDYSWRLAPDGGATFATSDGGFIYVANSEHIVWRAAGVGAIRFDRSGNIIDAYDILSLSWWNCSGGKTPWGTWLSGEEHPEGLVWECDPFGVEEAVALPALGLFYHEAVAVDPERKRLYLTEDRGDGRFYRFTADRMREDGWPDLSSGTLEAMRVTTGESGSVTWMQIPDPSAAVTPTREQVPETTAFDGGEGVWYHGGEVFFTTKGDDRIWVHDVVNQTVEVIYDAEALTDPVLTGVDFILVTEGGDMVVGEDGGDMQVVAVDRQGNAVPLAQIEGHDGSEITGIAFDPSLGRMIFSSQRGADGRGVTYMMEGPFFGPLPGA